MIGQRGIPSTYGGVETAVEEISTRLVMRGHSVTVYCHKNRTNQKYYKGIRLLSKPAIRRVSWETMSSSFLSTLDSLVRRFDVIHYHCLGPSCFSFLPRLFGLKTIVSIHSLNWKHSKWNTTAQRVIRLFELSAIYFPKITVVVSETMKKYFETKFKGAKIKCIPNGIAVDKPLPALRIHKLGLKERKYFLFVGRISEEKGCHILLDAFNRIKGNFKLVLAGDTKNHKKYAEELMSKSNRGVIFLKEVSKDMVNELYSNAYLFVLPSWTEGMSVALLEAMSFGLCPVVSDIPENREVVGRAGFLFRTGDVECLAGVLENLMNSPEAVERVGLAAADRVRTYFSWDKITDELEDMYVSLLN